MAKKYIGTNPLYVKTKDITEIDKIICAELNVGDLVVLEDENGEATKSYRVAKKTMADGMHLVFADTEHVEDVVYAYEDNVWVYDETKETELGSTEVVEWDGERNFTTEEYEKLASRKAILVEDLGNEETHTYTLIYQANDTLQFVCWIANDDGIVNGFVKVVYIYANGEYSSYEYDLNVLGTKLYKHYITIKNGNTKLAYLYLVNNSSTHITQYNISDANDFQYVSARVDMVKSTIASDSQDHYYNNGKLVYVCIDELKKLYFMANGEVVSADISNLSYTYSDEVSPL
jgi:hypothetical protein